MYVVEFDYRSDGGPMLCGPFGTRTAGDEWAGKQCPNASWSTVHLHVPDRV